MQAAVLLWLCAVIAGCNQNDTLEDYFIDYQQRLITVFDLNESIPIVPLARDQIKYPSRRALILNTEPLSMSLLELLRLSECELNRLIGEHNSSLNKFQGTEENLFYDLEFIRLADECINTRDQESALTQKIMIAKTEKRQALNRTVFNAIFGSKEFLQYFSVSAQLPSINQSHASLPAIALALQSLSLIAHKALAYQTNNLHDQSINYAPLSTQKPIFNEALGVLATQKRAGQWLLAMQTSLQQMQLIERTFKQKNAVANTCKKSVAGQTIINASKKKSLEYLFNEIYINKIQREFGTLKGAIDVNRALEPFIPITHDAKDPLNNYWQNTWGRAPNSISTQFLHAIIRHSQFWQHLLSECGIMQLPPIQ